MASEVDAAQDFVIVAAFENRHAAERMLVSLRHRFREKHHKRHATALVITGNKDGSLRLAQSRVLTASGFASTVIRISLSWTVGFIGITSMLRGGKSAVRHGRAHQSHVGSDEQAVHALLAQAGPDAALVLVCCDNRRDAAGDRCASGRSCKPELGRPARTVPRRPRSRHRHDWVRTAIGEPARNPGA